MAGELRPAAKKKRPHPKKAARLKRAKLAELALERRAEKAAKLYVAGWSIRDIAGHLKCSVGTAHSDVNSVLDRLQDKSDGRVGRSRAASLARLQVATKAIWDDVEDGDLDTIDRLVKLEARRSKLEGTEAAKVIELSGPEGAPVQVDDRSSLLERLAGLVAGAAPGGATSKDHREPDGGGG